MNINKAWEYAYKIVRDKNRNVFLSGKAGTGKTTFLQYVYNHVQKKKIILAYQGIAAYNAGGQTIHSFFHINPYHLFTPDDPFLSDKEGHDIRDAFKLNRSRIRLIQNLEMLIIDEISTVRVEILDIVDALLKKLKNSSQPFGGVQVLLVGDVFQLPPVAAYEEKKILSRYYKSIFFFDSRAYQNGNFKKIELQTVYRQDAKTEQSFIQILNRVRTGCVTAEDIRVLNKRVGASWSSNDYVILTTHRQDAFRGSSSQINREQLTKLTGKSIFIEAKVDGDFEKEKRLPGAKQLELKLGAKVVFTRNDPSKAKDYYNGTTGIVVGIDGSSHLDIQLDSGKIVTVRQAIWHKKNYTWDEKKSEMTEKVLGSFKQYPITLGWAIPIHKSQGMTLNRMVVDVSAAFEHGQVYVALSRCQSLQNLVLQAPLEKDSVFVWKRAQQFDQGL